MQQAETGLEERMGCGLHHPHLRLEKFSKRLSVTHWFRTIMNVLDIVEIGVDSLLRKQIWMYMQQAKAGLNRLMEMWAAPTDWNMEKPNS